MAWIRDIARVTVLFGLALLALGVFVYWSSQEIFSNNAFANVSFFLVGLSLVVIGGLIWLFTWVAQRRRA